MLRSVILEEAQQLTPAANSVVWPDIDTIRTLQQRHLPNEVAELDVTEGLWKREGRIWILQQDLKLQLRLMVCLHCDTVRNWGKGATKSILLESLWWKSLDKDAEKVVRTCYHCVLSRSEDVVPRPLGHGIHGMKPNEVVRLDFVHMGPESDSKHYILVIRDDLSSYIWLWPTSDTIADSAVEALYV